MDRQSEKLAESKLIPLPSTCRAQSVRLITLVRHPVAVAALVAISAFCLDGF